MARYQLCLGLVLLWTACSPAQDPAQAAIHRLLDQQIADWNRGDVQAFMTAYEDSPQTTFVGSTVQYGYATILDRYKKLYGSPQAMGKLSFSHLAIRILDEQYATATGYFHLQRTAAAGGSADGVFSLLFRKGPHGWKIILDHTSRTG